MPALLLKNLKDNDRFMIHPKINHHTEPSIDELAVQLNFTPKNRMLFEEAFTHSSYANEKSCPSNERLEFLGDSILGMIVCRFLYETYPNYTEGQLAKLKSTIVSAPLWASFSRHLGLDRYIHLGRGERRTQGNAKQNILADLFEAFIGAYYLNFGLEQTTAFVLPLIHRELPEIMQKFEEMNVKNDLQELLQAKGLAPLYRTVQKVGPPHDQTFTVEVVVENQVMGTGKGKSIKEAQNQAAAIALHALKPVKG